MIDNTSIEFIRLHENADIHALALQANRYPAIDMPFAIRQITGRQIAREKIPSWYNNEQLVYPPHISMEQCSSEKTAKYKASLCKGKRLVDLTGGLGVDFYFMSRQFDESIYVEKQTGLSKLAEHNFAVSGLKNTTIVNADAQLYLNQMPAADTIYIDPARRNTQGRKTVLIEDCTPNLIEIEALLDEKSARTIIKLSPMLDIALALKKLSNIAEVHIISCANECKELLLIKDRNKESATSLFRCVNILADKAQCFSFNQEEEEKAQPAYTTTTGNYLYEPNASILKAGAYKSVATRYQLLKLHPNSHLYTSGNLVEDFPGRCFRIQEVMDFNKKSIKDLASRAKANITTRNFPLSVDEIRKKTTLKDGGELYIFATTLANDKKILVLCEKV
ncbi:THUMP-like domain-containing protein [Viscerimonas tarda]